MSALFGVLGSPRLLDALSAAMPVATRNREIHDGDAAVIGRIGLAQSAGFFPHAEAVVTPAGDLAALRGYAWDRHGFPTTPGAAVELVGSMADRLVADGRLTVDGAALSGLFSLVAITRTHVHAVTDPSGLFPLYLLANRDGIAVSSHSRPLARAAGSSADLHGALQNAAFGYSIGPRTLFTNVSRLPAGAAVSIDRGSGKMTFVEQSVAYGKVQDYSSRDEAADAVWQDYVSGLSELARVPGCAGVLMSGGFDTRLVAMGLAESHRPITALTIGDPGNYEVRIAERVAQLSGARWRRRTAQPDLDALASRLPRLIAEAESANFPTCDSGGEELVADGATTLSTGYGGETVIGGQGSAQFLANTKAKRLWSVMHCSLLRADRPTLTDASVQDLITTMHAFHATMLRQLGNRIAPDLKAMLRHAEEALRAEISQEVARLLLAAPSTIPQLAERFWGEHHVCRHFGRQELTLDMHAPIALPTINTALFVRTSNLDPRWKTDHGIYFRMVRRHWGAFARIPTSNVPIALSNPAPLIWAARAARSIWDERQSIRQMRSKGSKGQRFGWSNYEVWARASSFLDELPHLIDDRLISREWLARKIAKQRSWTERFYSGQDYLTYLTIGGMIGDLL